jgi:acyl-CoA thioesterase-1
MMIAAAFFFALAIQAQQPRPEPGAVKADPILVAIEDKPGLPRVLLIGDSISMGYTLGVRARLAGIANVHRILENGGPTIRGIEKIDRWLGDQQWDVVHFNFGLHDLKRDDGVTRQVSPEEYEKNLRIITRKIKARAKRVIWASTTPVPEGKTSPPRTPADVPRYNEIAARVVKDEGVEINDLYSLALPNLKEWQRPVNVHFFEKGSEALADRVAEVIRRNLPAAR